ncbi:hypothetical protein ACSBR2_009277 [Camellia fascicularis]
MSMFLGQAINIQDFHKMIGRLFLVFLLIHSTFGQKHHHKPASQPWLTLSGKRPAVIARGGYSGLFPESSDIATQLAVQTSLPDVAIFCSLQLSKDNQGYCLSTLNLDNATNIQDFFPKGQKTYNVNGKSVQGYFALDFTSDQLLTVSLIQGIYTRANIFDGIRMPIFTIQKIMEYVPPPARFWLNVQYSSFYALHKLNPALYVQNLLQTTLVEFVSSPEIGFLKSMKGKVGKSKAQFIFMFLEENAVEPTTNQTYGSLLKDLSTIKLFASGILVPKGYIWPVNAQMYLEAPTTVVADAHKAGLEVYAYNFANDQMASYNYSYEPTAEYLQYIDNSQFSVDGFLTDYPSTASEAIACLAHNKNATRPVKGKRKPLVISHHGASGFYPGSTDLAYQKAVDDGADIIDCSVQMSKDGVAFCSSSADLASATTAKATFIAKSSTIPEIQSNSGIFSFDLTWSEIQTLQPLIASPFATNEGMNRNPAYKSKGKFITLAEFLELSKEKKVFGILIGIKNAAYLASKKGIDLIDTVSTALSNATFDKETTQQVLIQSDDGGVLSKFSNVPTYKRVFLIEETVGDAPKPTVDEIKKFANAVNIRKGSIIKIANDFTITPTNVVQEMRKANLTVYSSVFRNEFTGIAMDLFSDPIVELATFIAPPFSLDGIVTDYPATAITYLKSPCFYSDEDLEYSILPVVPGAIFQMVPEGVELPPVGAPAPALDVKDVVDPPLPPVSNVSAANVTAAAAAPNAAAAPPPEAKSSQTANVANFGLTLIAIMVLSLLSVAR